MMESIKTGKLVFASPDWDSVSVDGIYLFPNNLARDLIKQCLTVDPNVRLTCSGILQHPWMVKEVSHADNASARNRLKKYQARRRLKMATTVVYFSKLMERKIR
jgi:serine/threonine protein kinase